MPPVFSALTVYPVVGLAAVGVPVIFPEVAERARPAGRAGDTDQDTTAPPVEVGEIVLMALPTA